MEPKIAVEPTSLAAVTATPAMDIIAPPKPQSVNTAVVEAPIEVLDETVAGVSPTPPSSNVPLEKTKIVKQKPAKLAHTVSMSTVVVVLAAVFFVGLSSLAYYAYVNSK